MMRTKEVVFRQEPQITEPHLLGEPSASLPRKFALEVCNPIIRVYNLVVCNTT